MGKSMSMSILKIKKIHIYTVMENEQSWSLSILSKIRVLPHVFLFHNFLVNQPPSSFLVDVLTNPLKLSCLCNTKFYVKTELNVHTSVLLNFTRKC